MPSPRAGCWAARLPRPRPPTEQPPGGHRYPQARRALGISPPGARPRPAAPFGNRKALLDPGPPALPTRFAALGGQVGPDEPRLLVARLPAGQQETVQVAGATHEGGPAP